MASRSRVLAALLLLPFASIGCQDDQDIRALTKLAHNTTTQTADSRSEAVVAPSPPGKLARFGGSLVELPGRAGWVEWVHKTGEAAGRLYVSDSQSHPIENVTEPRIWLAGPTGPQEVRVESCRPAEPGCWQAGSPYLAESAARGLLRFQIGREGYRIALPTRQPGPVTKPSSGQAKPPEQPEQPK